MVISAYQRIILPRPGKPFVFVKTPSASYASVGEIYMCDYDRDRLDIALHNISRDSLTYDRISAWRYAIWHYANSPQKIFGPFE